MNFSRTKYIDVPLVIQTVKLHYSSAHTEYMDFFRYITDLISVNNTIVMNVFKN